LGFIHPLSEVHLLSRLLKLAPCRVTSENFWQRVEDNGVFVYIIIEPLAMSFVLYFDAAKAPPSLAWQIDKPRANSSQ
jgi:hypothetical protein